MDKDRHDEAPQSDSTGCVLLGLYPFLLVGGVFVAGGLERSGNRYAGWMWIPLSILVMFAFAVIRYRVTAKNQHQGFSFPVFAKSVFEFVGMQIVVLLVLGLIAMLLARLNPFSGLGNSW